MNVYDPDSIYEWKPTPEEVVEIEKILADGSARPKIPIRRLPERKTVIDPETGIGHQVICYDEID